MYYECLRISSFVSELFTWLRSYANS